MCNVELSPSCSYVKIEEQKSGGRSKQRESAIELLRILAMFLVLVVHADFFSLGPSTFGQQSLTIFDLSKVFIESVSIVCVNVFVMISGWFGIHPKMKNFMSFIFQCLFFFIGIYVTLVILGFESFNIKSIAQCFWFLPNNWFIKSYILLYILSPILNVYCANSSEKKQRNVLIGYFIFQSLYGWLTPGVGFFNSGYSTISFIGLYLLMQYIKKSNNRFFCFSVKINLMIYIGSCIITTILYVVGSWYSIPRVNILFSYISPLAILSSMFLFLSFVNLKMQNGIINWIAKSSFAVYLLHCYPYILHEFYAKKIKKIFVEFNGVESFLLASAFLCSIFIAAIILDQPRKYLWSLINKTLKFRYYLQ